MSDTKDSEPERLSYEWHAQNAEAEETIALGAVDYARGTPTDVLIAREVEEHRDLAQKLRLAAELEAKLKIAMDALKDYADLGGTSWVEHDCGDHAKAAIKAMETPDAE